MSRVVDERVVSMQFDNRQFERNISNTMSTLEKFNGNIGGLGTAVEKVGSKFSAMEVMAVTALANITNSAVNAGKRIVSALTIEPVKTGFNEYELKMGSIQTIMAGTGESLETVNKYLEELNEYSDKTIYSFADMTNNIGKFTNAGVKLEDAVAAIKGVSNVAAVSGANTNEASRAMYNFAQALSSGYVKLVDWKSIELANMGTVEFKQQLIDAAVAAGTLTKTADGMYKTLEGHTFNATKGFNDNLQDQWMTTEVLVNTLRDYADETTEIGNKASKAATEIKTLTMLFDTLKESAQSGWAQTWEILVGDFEEAKVLWTDVNNAISPILDSMAKSRNELLTTWKELGGRTTLINALRDAFEGVMNIASTVKDAFRDIFKQIEPKQLIALSDGIKNFAEGFKKLTENAEIMDKVRRTAKGVFATFSIGVQIVKALWGAFKRLVEYISPAGNGLLGFTAKLGDSLVKFDAFIKSGDIFNKIVGKIATVLGGIVNIFKKVVSGLKVFGGVIIGIFDAMFNVDTSGMDGLFDRIRARLQPITKLGELVAKAFDKIVEKVKELSPALFKIASKIGFAFSEITSTIVEKIADGIDNFDFNRMFDFLNGGLLSGLLVTLIKFVNSLSKIKMGDLFSGSMFDKIKTAFSGLATAMDNINGILSGVKDTLAAYQSQLKANTLIKIAGAIGIMAASLLVLSFIDSAKLTSSLTAMTVMLTELMGSMAIFSKISGSGDKGIMKFASSMILVSASVLILSFAMANLARLDMDGIMTGIVGVAALSGILVTTAKLLSKSSGKMMKGVGSLVIFAVAIRVLVKAVEKLGALDIASLAKGLVGVGVLCAELALFLKVADLDGMGALKGVGLLALAAAVNVLATAVGKFGAMDQKAITQGLIGVGVVLAELAAFLKLTGDSKKVLATAVGLTVLGAAMLIFASAVSKFGGMSWEELGKGLFGMASALVVVIAALRLMPKNIFGTALSLVLVASTLAIIGRVLGTMGSMSWEGIAKGLVALAGSLTIMAVAMHAMKNTASGAASMLVMAGALAILAPVLKMFGGMSVGEIAKSLLTLAGAFAVLGVAGYVLGPLVPAILSLAGAVALIGIGCLAAGAGLLALSVALGAVSVSAASFAGALVVVVTSVVGLIPVILQKVGEGIVALATAIGNGADAILVAVVQIISAILDALIATVPKLVETCMFLLSELLSTLLSYMPQLVETGMKLVTSLIQGIANNIQSLVMAAVDLINNFLNGIRLKFPDIIQTAVDLVISFVNGIAAAIDKNAAPMTQAVINVVKSVIKAVFSSLKTFRTEFKEAGKDLLNGFVNGIKSKVTDAANAARDIGKKALNSIKDFLGINSPSKELFAVGVYADEGLIKGMDSLGGDVADSAEGVADNALGSFANILSGLKDSINGEVECEPTITPVIDMSKFNSGLAQIKNKLANTGVLNVATNNAKAQEVSRSVNGDSGVQNGTAKTATGNVFNYTQNNYSPKPLSRIDIYRQTQNQFSTMERMVALK